MLANVAYIGWRMVEPGIPRMSVDQMKVAEEISFKYHEYRRADSVKKIKSDKSLSRNKAADNYWQWQDKNCRHIDDTIHYNTCVRVIQALPYRAIVYVSAPFLPLCTMRVNSGNVFCEHIKFSSDKKNAKRLTKQQCKTVLASILADVVKALVNGKQLNSTVIIYGRNYYDYNTEENVDFMLSEQYSIVEESENIPYQYCCRHSPGMMSNLSEIGGYEIDKFVINHSIRKKKEAEYANILKPIIVCTDVQDNNMYPKTGACALYAYLDVVRHFSSGIMQNPLFPAYHAKSIIPCQLTIISCLFQYYR